VYDGVAKDGALAFEGGDRLFQLLAFVHIVTPLRGRHRKYAVAVAGPRGTVLWLGIKPLLY
jgi:hypothetical protein